MTHITYSRSLDHHDIIIVQGILIVVTNACHDHLLHPPSTLSVVPLQYPPASLTRNRMAEAISGAVPVRFKLHFSMCGFMSSAGTLAISGVSMAIETVSMQGRQSDKRTPYDLDKRR